MSTDPDAIKSLRLFGQPTTRRAWASIVDADAVEHPEVEAFGATDVGQVRQSNQDQYLIAELERGLLVRSSSLATPDGTSMTDAPQGYLFAVADGVGGLVRGDVASAVAIDAVAHYALTVMPWLLAAEELAGAASDGLRKALERAQARVERVARRAGLEGEMASTFTMAYVTWPNVYVAHVGDSRCYLEHEGEIDQLTRDHTLAEQLLEQGVDPERVVGTRAEHVLLNSLGGEEGLDVDLIRARLQPGDHLVLCTDGLSGYVSMDELASRLSPDEQVEDIVDGLLATANERGGKDNITMVLARF